MAETIEFDDGEQDLPQSSVKVVAPGWRGTVRVLRSGGGVRSGGGDKAIATRLPEAALSGAEMDTLAELEVEASPRASSTGARGGGDKPVRLKLKKSRSDRDYALISVDPSGAHRWILPQPHERGGAVEFVLPETTHAPTADPTSTAEKAGDGKRGAGVAAMKLGARIVSWVTGDITGKAAQWVAAQWEAKSRPYFLKEIALDGSESNPDWRKLSSGRALLLIHGTFSTPAGAFFGLFNREEFKTILAHYEGRCFALAHPSLSEDIEENLSYLKSALPPSLALDVDILCHSRGGLVSRAIAAAAASGELPLKVGKLVMVAAPNRGTPLADKDHWVEFIDRNTNLLVDLPDTASTITMEGVLCLVKIVGGEALGGLPGLATMEAKGETIARLQKSELGSTELYAIIASYSPPEGSRLFAFARQLGDKAVKGFFEEDNDLVVPTNGCYDLSGAQGFPLDGARIFRVKDPSVNHVTFFESSEVREILEKILT